MTTHVVCLDGTAQVRTQLSPTNVALIFDAMGGDIGDAGKGSFESRLLVNGREAQIGKYLPGVGTEGPILLQKLDQSVGGGIAEPIVRGYTFLSRSYKNGDDIIIVGFSRGAAAARCLAGFIAGQGLLNPANYIVTDKDGAYLRAIAAWYAHRAGDPNLARASNLLDIAQDFGRPIPALDDDDFIEVERIKAVAVFDTVSSVGAPRIEADGWIGYDFTLADTVLNGKTLNGFHALAADETRATFFPTLWTPRANITQVIFPGGHSDVGGGYDATALSDIALQWMLTKLAGQGLRFDVAALKRKLAPDPNGLAHDESDHWYWKLFPRAPRVFPVDTFAGEPAFAIDPSIRQRWGQTVTLLPQNISSPYASLGMFFGPKPLYAVPPA